MGKSIINNVANCKTCRTWVMWKLVWSFCWKLFDSLMAPLVFTILIRIIQIWIFLHLLSFLRWHRRCVFLWIPLVSCCTFGEMHSFQHKCVPGIVDKILSNALGAHSWGDLRSSEFYTIVQTFCLWNVRVKDNFALEFQSLSKGTEMGARDGVVPGKGWKLDWVCPLNKNLDLRLQFWLPPTRILDQHLHFAPLSDHIIHALNSHLGARFASWMFPLNNWSFLWRVSFSWTFSMSP